MEKQNEHKILNIVSKYKHLFKNKDDFFSLLLELNKNTEFKTNFSYVELYDEISTLYKDPKPAYFSNVFTPDPVPKDDLKEDDIFIFGSNTEGKHGAGAAKFAVDHKKAIYGQSKGLQGESYAIITKDLSKGNKSVDISYIEEQICELIDFCINHKDKTFWMTKIGCGLGGFKMNDIAPLFSNKIIPNNLILPKEFVYPHFYIDFLYSETKKTFYKLNKEKNNIICISTETPSVKTIPFKFDDDNNIFEHIPYDVVTVDEDDFNVTAQYILKKIF